MDEPIEELHGFIVKALHKTHSFPIDKARDEFEREITKIPYLLDTLAQGKWNNQTNSIVKTLECNYVNLENYELVCIIDESLKWVISQLVGQILVSGMVIVESLVPFFREIIMSVRFNHIGIKWAEDTQKSWEVADCIAYCEIVDAGIKDKMIWEECFEGARQKERSEKLYSILCDQDVWLQKRQAVATFFANHITLAKSTHFQNYLEVPLPSNRFEETNKYIMREVDTKGLHFNDKLREQLIKEMHAANNMLEKLQRNLDDNNS